MTFDIRSCNGQQGKKEGKKAIQIFEYLENEKRFLEDINVFHNFTRTLC